MSESASEREQFLAGERPDDVAIYLAEGVVDDPDALAGYGERLEDGILLVVPGERGRNAFSTATGKDAMAFAKEAMGEEGEIDADLSGGSCPDCGDDEIRIVFAFAEEPNEEVGGIYAEGTVIHAYAQCSCGAAFSQRWVAGER
jgi:hypothetical protein